MRTEERLRHMGPDRWTQVLEHETAIAQSAQNLRPGRPLSLRPTVSFSRLENSASVRPGSVGACGEPLFEDSTNNLAQGSRFGSRPRASPWLLRVRQGPGGQGRRSPCPQQSRCGQGLSESHYQGGRRPRNKLIRNLTPFCIGAFHNFRVFQAYHWHQ